MSNPFQPAIDELEKDLVPIERKRNELVSTINVLRAKAGLPPRPDNSGPGGSQPHDAGKSLALSQLKHDSFFGKRMGTAAREYLEMRFAAVNGTNPASVREIFDALKEGGFVFETKHNNVAMISLRNMLRKGSQTFLKLPNGSYGLRSWYPGAKKPKDLEGQIEEEEEEILESEAATPKKGAAA